MNKKKDVQDAKIIKLGSEEKEMENNDTIV